MNEYVSPHCDQGVRAANIAVAANQILPLNEAAPTRAYVDFACLSDDGILALIGWSFDPEKQIQGFGLLKSAQDGLLKTKKYSVTFLAPETSGVTIDRVSRPDVAHAMSVQEKNFGFVLVLPQFRREEQLVLVLKNGRYILLPFVALENPVEITSALRRFWAHSGNEFLQSLESSLGSEHSMTQLAANIADGGVESGLVRFAACDQVLLLNKRTLIINGWIAMESARVVRIEIWVDGVSRDITASIRRYMRPDLVAAYPWSEEQSLGILCAIPDIDLAVTEFKLKVVGVNGHVQVIRADVVAVDNKGIGTFINQHPNLATLLLDILSELSVVDDNFLSILRINSFLSRYQDFPMLVDQPATVIGAIDRAYPLGDGGLLMFGWHFMPKRKPVSVSVINDEGEAVDVTNAFISTLRMDVAENLRARFSQVDDWCGYICHAPMPTMAGQPRVLCFDFGALGEVYLKIPAHKLEVDGTELIKEMLGMIPAPDRMRHQLYGLFSRGLGQAIEAVNRSRPPFGGRIEEAQYGTPNDTADISVIVPLYGRFDFLRHQLAQFADDADFGRVDLVYVVDDPAILSQTLELAARYQPLFGLPFRVVWYGENRGFAGANNIGARVARGDYLVLLNSDAFPRHPGWLGTLQTALDELPDAGAVGPLLQFADDTIQHAGMYPRRDPLLPGFLLNTHKAMGMTWEGGDEPSEHPMLTAACLMLRRADYEALGGFDEGYVIGDFEDSDLCLALRKQGKRLWLVPQARLWHLERQSQNLANAVGQRQMITLFNGWRYNEKIRTGKIADPTEVAAAAEVQP